MLSSHDFQGHAEKLSNPSIMSKDRLQYVTDIRDSLEVVHSADYPVFLKYFVPVLETILYEGAPEFKETTEQSTRKIALEILHRLPLTDPFKDYLDRILKVCIKLLKEDNEENALVCLQTIFNLHKGYRNQLEVQVNPFLEFVKQMYETLPTTVKEVFASQTQTPAQQLAAIGSGPAMQTPNSGFLMPENARAMLSAADLGQNRGATRARVTRGAEEGSTEGAQGTTTQGGAAIATPTRAQRASFGSLGISPGQGLSPLNSVGSAPSLPPTPVASASPLPTSASTPTSAGSIGQGVPSPSQPARGQQPPSLVHSCQSFKVMAELPLIVMLLFQLYQKLMQSTIQQLISLMITSLKLKVDPNVAPHLRVRYNDFMAAQVKTLSFLTYLAKQYPEMMKKHREDIPDCVILLLEHCPPKAYAVRKDILVATRHILATECREFKSGFFDKVNRLLDERVLLGDPNSSNQMIRTVACSALADLVHIVRADLDIKQLSKIIFLFSRNIHDASMPLPIQNTSAKVLLNLVEHIFRKKDDSDGLAHTILVRIFDCFVRKLGTLKNLLQDLGDELRSSELPPEKDPELSFYFVSMQDQVEPSQLSVQDRIREAKHFFKTTLMGLKTVVWSVTHSHPSKTPPPMSATQPSQNGFLTEEEIYMVCKLVRNGLECLLVCGVALSDSQDGKPDRNAQSRAFGRTRNFMGMREDGQGDQEIDLIGFFAEIFAAMDTRSYQDVLRLEMKTLLAAMRKHSPLVMFFERSLRQKAINRQLVEVLLDHLHQHSEELFAEQPPVPGLSAFAQESKKVPEPHSSPPYASGLDMGTNAASNTSREHDGRSPQPSDRMKYCQRTVPGWGRSRHSAPPLVLQLYETIFASKNETDTDTDMTARPMFPKILLSCVDRISKVADPTNYLLLLRCIFTYIPTKWEMLYSDFHHHAARVFPALNRMLLMSPLPNTRHLILELHLTMPLRTSAQLSYLHFVVPAIKECLEDSSPNLLTLGLESLDSLIDCLRPDFLLSKLDPFMPDILHALYSHLQPLPYPYGMQAATILGKLGGANRRHNLEAAGLEVKSIQTPPVLRATIEFSNDIKGVRQSHKSRHSTRVDLNIDDCVERAFVIFKRTLDESVMASSFEIIRCAILSTLSPSTKGKAGQEAVSLEALSRDGLKYHIEQMLQAAAKEPEDITFNVDQKGFRSSCPQTAMARVFKRLVTMLLIIAGRVSQNRLSTRSIRPDVQELLDGLVVHFSVLLPSVPSVTSEQWCAGDFFEAGRLHPIIFLETLLDEMGSSNRASAAIAAGSLERLVSCCKTVCDSPKVCARFDFWNEACDALVHMCYERLWNRKCGGCIGLRILINNLGPGWTRPRQLRLLETLMFVLQDVAPEIAAAPTKEASDALDALIATCNQGFALQSMMSAAPQSGVLAESDTKDIEMKQEDEDVDMKDSDHADSGIVKDEPMAESEDTKSPIDTGLSGTDQKGKDLRNLVSSLCGFLAHTSLRVQKKAQGLIHQLVKLEKSNYRARASSITGVRSEAVKSEATAPETAATTPATRECMAGDIVKPFVNDVLALALAPSTNDDEKLASIHCLTFLLGLQPAVLEVDVAIHKTLIDELELCDQAVAQPQSPAFPSMGISGLQMSFGENNSPGSSEFNIARLKFLCAAMTCPSVTKNSSCIDFRNKSTKMLFQCLIIADSSIVKVAKDGLCKMIQTQEQKVPKELLQSSLRPILLTLADYRTLTVALLEGLAHLLHLLASCFNQNLGEKLLDHLKKFQDPPAPSMMQRRNGDETPIVAAIINLFHLLPQTPEKFLEPLVQSTTQLEAMLPTGLTSQALSPYRKPLVKFLICRPTESVTLFLKHLAEPGFSAIFRSVLSMEIAKPLREALASDPLRILNASGLVDPDPHDPSTSAETLQETRVQGIQIIKIISQHDKSWLSRHPEVLKALVSVWHSVVAELTSDKEEQCAPTHVYLSKWIIDIFLIYCRYQQRNTLDCNEILFIMLLVFTRRTLIDFAFLERFYKVEVAQAYKPLQKRKLLTDFFAFFQREGANKAQRVEALRLIVIPMLFYSLRKNEGSEIMPSDIIRTVIMKMVSGDQVSSYDELLHVELLKLATLLIHFMHDNMVEHRKELIKFGWNHLKNEDSWSKRCAYVNVSRFIQKYETPPKIILQVYVALLRTHNTESRHLVRQALDILTPSLPDRLPSEPHRHPTWIKWTKKIIVEDGYNMTQLFHIFQLLVRHSRLFYSSRNFFIPQMVSSLNRYGMQGNGTDNKKLAVDLAQLIINWSTIAASERGQIARTPADTTPPDTGPRKRQRLGSNADAGQMSVPSSPARSGSRVQPSPIPGEDLQPMKDALVTFLLRMAVHTLDPQNAGTNQVGPELVNLSNRCVDLLNDLLIAWPDHPIKAQYLEKLSQCSVKQGSQMLVAGIKLITVAIKHQGADFIRTNPSLMEHILQPCIQAESVNLGEELGALLDVFTTRCPHSNSDVKEVYSYISHQIEMIFRQPEKDAKIYIPLLILESVAKVRPNFLDSFAPQLVKHMQRLGKEHLTKRPSDRDQSSESDSLVNRKLIAILNVCHVRLQLWQDQRKVFLQSLTSLIDKCVDPEILSTVIHIFSEWLIRKPALCPGLSVKEKTNFLLKMTAFEQLDQPELMAKFLKIILDLYGDTTGSSTKSDLLSKIERCFMIGLRSPNREIRHQFFTLFSRSVGSNLGQRMAYILRYQNWESLADSYWLVHATELILAVSHDNQSVVNTFRNPSFPLFTPSKEALSIPASGPQAEHAAFGAIPPVPVSFALEGEMPRPKKRRSASTTQQPADLMEDIDTELQIETVNPVQRLKRTFPASSLKGLAEEHGHIMGMSEKVTGGSLISALRTLIHYDRELVHKLWVQLFARIWDSLLESDRKALIPHMIAQLSKEHHTKQIHSTSQTPGCIGSILLGFAECENCPNLPPELLKYLAKTHSAWHAAVEILEVRLAPLHSHMPTMASEPEQVPTYGGRGRGRGLNKMKKRTSRGGGRIGRPNKGATPLGVGYRPADSPGDGALEADESQKEFIALISLYSQLGADDVLAGAWCTRSGVATETKVALVSEQCGRWSQAQLAYYRIMKKAHSVRDAMGGSGTGHRGRGRTSSANSLEESFGYQGDLSHAIDCSQAERALWEERWVACAKQLNYWDVLTEFSRNTQHTDLSLECAWKIPSWAELKDIFGRTQMESTPQRQLYQSYVLVIENKLTPAEESGRDGVQLVLKKWCQLPVYDGNSHINLLRVLQQYVELQESCEMLSEVQSTQGRNTQLPGIRNVFRCWRERQPNVWEGIAVWNDVLTWRNHMFAHISQHIQQLIKNDQTLAHMGFKEMAWTVVRFAHVARKHKLYEVCLNSLNKLFAFQTNITIDAEDAYVKISEQCKCYIEKKPTDDLKACLTSLSKIDTASFSKEQNSDVYQLKGRLLQLVYQHVKQANECFDKAVSLCSHQPNAWLAWGNYCMEMWQSSPTRDTSFAEDAVCCFIQAIRSNSKHTHQLVARVLWLLSVPKLGEKIGPMFEAAIPTIPMWVWIDWIPELLEAVNRGEGRYCKQLLLLLAEVHPHSVLYPLHTRLQQMRSKVLASSRPNPPPPYKSVPLPRVTSSQTPPSASASPMTVPSPGPAPAAIPTSGTPHSSSPRVSAVGGGPEAAVEGTPGSTPSTPVMAPSRISLPPSAAPAATQPPSSAPANTTQSMAPVSSSNGVPSSMAMPVKTQPSTPMMAGMGGAQSLYHMSPSMAAHAGSIAGAPGIGLPSASPAGVGSVPRSQQQYARPLPTFTASNVQEEIWHRLVSKHHDIVQSSELAMLGLVQLSEYTSVERCYDIITTLLNSLLECHASITNVREIKDALDLLNEETRKVEQELQQSVRSTWKSRQSKWLIQMCSSQLNSLPLTSVKPLIPQLLHWQTLLGSHIRSLPRTCPLEQVSPLLSQLGECHVVLLLPHQLIPAYPHMATANIPYPNSHVDHNLYFPGTWAQMKWLHVSADVTVGRRLGATGRGVHILCTDGRTRSLWVRHRAQLSILSHQRMAKVARLIHSQLQRHITAQAMGLSLNVPSPMCVGPNVEAMWYEGPEPRVGDEVEAGRPEASCVDVSMEDVIDDYMGETGLGPNEGMAIFWHEVEHLFEEGATDQSEDKVIQRKLQMYNAISNHVISKDCLQRFVQQRLALLDHTWGLRRRFTLRYACLSLLSHIFGIRFHRPNELQLSLQSGYLYLGDAAMHMDERSDSMTMEHPAVPIPLYNNFVNFMRPFSFGGPYVNSIAVMAEGVITPLDHMEVILNSVLRSELLDRHAHDPHSARDVDTDHSNAIQLGERATRITNSIFKDVQKFVVENALDSEDPMKGSVKPVNTHLLSVLEASMNPSQRLNLSVSHQPWF